MKKIVNLAQSFLSANWQKVVVIILVIVLILSLKSCNEKQGTIDDLKKLSSYNDSVSNSKIVIWTDKYNNEHYQVTNLTVASQQAMAFYTDSIAKLLKIKASSITSTSSTTTDLNVKVNTKVDTSYQKIPCLGDSVLIAKTLSFHWNDTWMNIDGSVGDGVALIDVNGIDTLKRVDYSKRSWFLGRKYNYTDFTNTNPHMKITGYKGIQLETNNINHWSIGPYIGVGYSGEIQLTQLQFQFGVSLQYSLIRF